MRIDDKWGKEALSIIKGIDANVLVTSLSRSYTYDECKQFDLIASCTTGTDHIDNQDIPLICLKGETEFLQHVHATAEHTWALIMSLIRKVPWAFDDVKRGNWNREAWQGTELHGKVLGLVGLGRVGQQVVQFAKAFGMYVYWHDPYKAEGMGIQTGRLDELLKISDIITVHVPLNDETRYMFDYKQFHDMKPSAYFVNTSRGAVISEDALIWALENKKIAGAALDVVQNEPEPWGRLIEYANKNNNLLLTPHLGGQTAESRHKTQVFIVSKIVDYINSKESE